MCRGWFRLDKKVNIITKFIKKIKSIPRTYENFDVEILNNTSRNPFKHPLIDELNDDDRWLIMSNGREKNMNWLVCIPKQIVNRKN